MSVFKTCLLVDDDEATLFYNRIVIQNCDFAGDIAEAKDGREALEYLCRKQGDAYPQPDVIFLDINMPRMDGWQFLDEYSRLPAECRAGAVIAMLTTSSDPRDRERARAFDCVATFQSKPLDQEKLTSILHEIGSAADHRSACSQ